MSVDNFRVYDIRMLPAQEIKTIYDAFFGHYIGKKDFKEVFGDIAFKQVLTEMKNSTR